MKSNVKRKIWIIIVIAVVLVCGGIILFVSNYALNMACLPDNPRRNNLDMCMEEVFHRYPDMRQWRDSLLTEGLWRDTFIVADDGLQRHAYILTHKTSDNIEGDSITGATVVVHGYCDNSARMMRYYYLHYEKLHRNCLVPDLYGHGLSEGRNVRFGWLDRLDVAKIWLPMAHNLWPNLDLVQHGLSMGGATTMMTSGEDIPDSLRLIGFIEDCGYNNTYELMCGKMNEEVGLPAFPFMNITNWLCNIRFGWKMSDADAQKQLAKCKRPMFFIHGDADTYVPFYMLEKNYNAKTQGYKEMWVAPGSEHAESIHDHWDEYVDRVARYIKRIESSDL